MHDDYINPSKIKVELKLSPLEKILLNIKKFKWILLIGLLFFLLALFGLFYFEPFSMDKPAETNTTLISKLKIRKYISKTKYSELYKTTTSVVSRSQEQEYSDQTTDSGLIQTTKTAFSTSVYQNIADQTLETFSTTKRMISTTLKAENSKIKGKKNIDFFGAFI